MDVGWAKSKCGGIYCLEIKTNDMYNTTKVIMASGLQNTALDFDD